MRRSNISKENREMEEEDTWRCDGWEFFRISTNMTWYSQCGTSPSQYKYTLRYVILKFQNTKEREKCKSNWREKVDYLLRIVIKEEGFHNNKGHGGGRESEMD